MSTFNDCFTVSRQLGSGGYGSVFKVYCKKTGDPYAAKFFADDRVNRYTFSPEDGMAVPDEIFLWRSLRHKSIIKYITFFFERGTWIVVMEHCSGFKDLFSYINDRKVPVSETTAAKVVSQTLSAIMYCRSKKIDHRDIKDENILYNPKTKQIKLIDFGSASLISESYDKLQGTDIYHPPEFHLNGKFKSTDGIVWAIGSLAFVLLNGDIPYENVQDITEEKIAAWSNETVSSTARRFVRRTLRSKPIDRESLTLLQKSAWLKQ